MNRYSWLTLALVAVSMVVYSVVTIRVFSRGLEQRMRESERRMRAFAHYCGDYVDHTVRDERLGAAHVDTWLEDLCARSGFERIVIADSLMLVHWSSQPLIRRGDDLTPFLLDTALFHAAVARDSTYLSPTVAIDGAWFTSLYQPLRIDGEPFVVVVEADRNYLNAARRFRDNSVLAAVVTGTMLLLLTAAVAAIGTRARKAQDAARRNEQLAFLGRASAELAHELKNPLGIIKSSADVLRRRFDPQRTNAAFDFLADETMRLGRMVDRILTFSRGAKQVRAPFAPHEVLATYVEGFGGEHPHITVVNDLSPSTMLTGDRDAFVQVVSNLLQNAAGAMEGAGRIEVREERRGAGMRLSFVDDGPGIAPDIAAKLFEPFVSGSRTGTGLGLAIVKTLCDAAGWGVALKTSKPGHTCFVIDIPEELWATS